MTIYKLTVIGDSAVGKTALLTRMIKDTYNNYQSSSTIGASFNTLNISKKLTFHIWDTAGQERFKSLVPMYLRGSDVVLIVYDIDNEDSLYNAYTLWFKYLNETLEVDEQPIIYLVANKIDKHKDYNSDTISRLSFVEKEEKIRLTNFLSEDGKEEAYKIKARYWEASAKTGYGVNELLNDIIENVNKYTPNKHVKDKFVKDKLVDKLGTEGNFFSRLFGCT